MNLRWISIGRVVAVMLFGAGGTASALTIGDVLASPQTYDGQSVTVSGTVAIAIPVGSESVYDLRDGAVKISVVSRTLAPTTGSSLTVTGTVHSVPDDEAPNGQLPPFLVETSRTP
jgi:hypothetical protein